MNAITEITGSQDFEAIKEQVMYPTTQNNTDTSQNTLQQYSELNYGGLLEGVGPTARELSVLSLGLDFVMQVVRALRTISVGVTKI